MEPPKDCFRTNRFQAKCDTCGQAPSVLHIPLKRPGRYCEACCPSCSEGAPERKAPEPWLHGRG